MDNELRQIIVGIGLIALMVLIPCFYLEIRDQNIKIRAIKVIEDGANINLNLKTLF